MLSRKKKPPVMGGSFLFDLWLLAFGLRSVDDFTLMRAEQQFSALDGEVDFELPTAIDAFEKVFHVASYCKW